MPRRQKRKKVLTPKSLLDRIGFQLYCATSCQKRLEIHFEPDAEDFKVDIGEEMRELGQRLRTALKRLEELRALPDSAWEV